MTIWDGFMLWIGKTLAEIAIVVVVIAAFGLFVWWQDGKNERARNRSNAAKEQG